MDLHYFVDLAALLGVIAAALTPMFLTLMKYHRKLAAQMRDVTSSVERVSNKMTDVTATVEGVSDQVQNVSNRVMHVSNKVTGVNLQLDKNILLRGEIEKLQQYLMDAQALIRSHEQLLAKLGAPQIGQE